MAYYYLYHNDETNAGVGCESLWLKEETYWIPTYPDNMIKQQESVDFISPYPLDELPDYPANSGCFLLVSLPFTEWIQSIVKKQLINAKSHIFNEGLTDYREYNLIHVPHEVNAINKEKTKYHEFVEQHRTEKVIDSNHLILRKEKLANHHLFRVKGLPGSYFISKHLKDAIESNGFTGMRFEKVRSE